MTKTVSEENRHFPTRMDVKPVPSNTWVFPGTEFTPIRVGKWTENAAGGNSADQ